MRRLVYLIMASLWLFAACSVPASPDGGDLADAGGIAGDAPTRLVLALESDADSIVTLAAESFCRKAEILSRGQVAVTIKSSEDVFHDLATGEADVILADSDSAGKRHRYFQAASAGFQYSSYEDFTLTLNSEKILRTLSRVSGAHIFGAYYMGSNVLAGGGTPDEILLADRGGSAEIAGGSDMRARMYVIPDSGVSDALDLVGVPVNELENGTERLSSVFEEDVLSEFMFREISPEALEAARLERERSSLGEGGGAPEEDKESAIEEEEEYFELSQVVITRSFHSARPLWLVLSSGLYDSLPDAEKDAFRESAAFLAAMIDDGYLGLETERLNELEDQGVAVSERVTATRARVTKARRSAAEQMPLADRAFFDMLDSTYR